MRKVYKETPPTYKKYLDHGYQIRHKLPETFYAIQDQFYADLFHKKLFIKNLAKSCKPHLKRFNHENPIAGKSTGGEVIILIRPWAGTLVMLKTPDTYHMQNSAVLKDPCQQKIYPGFLKNLRAFLGAEGFQVVIRPHHSNNSAVHIPKLKYGLIISSTHFDERFQFLLEIKYFIDPARRRAYGKLMGLDLET